MSKEYVTYFQGRTSRLTLAMVAETSLRMWTGAILAFVSASSRDAASSSIKGSVTMTFVSGSIAFHFFETSPTTSFDLSFGCPAGNSGSVVCES